MTLKKILFSQTCVHLLHYQLNLANIRICIHCYAIPSIWFIVACLSEKVMSISISGVLFVVRGSARVTCVCSSSYSLSV